VSTPVFTVANQLTLLRMALVPLLVVLVLEQDFTWACVVFVVAAVTDLLDGMIARLGHQQTKLGAMLDPVADKLLIGSLLIVLTWGQELVVAIPRWLTVTVLCRDAMLVVSVVIFNLAVDRRVFYPTLLGKASSALQLVTVGLVLLANALGGLAGLPFVFWATLLLTVGSALQYAFRGSRDDESAEG
jgi:cardiolipin synthase